MFGSRCLVGRSPAPAIIGLVAWLGQAGGESGNSATTHSRRGGVQVKIIIADCLIDASTVYPEAWFKSRMLTNDVRWHVILVEHPICHLDLQTLNSPRTASCLYLVSSPRRTQTFKTLGDLLECQGAVDNNSWLRECQPTPRGTAKAGHRTTNERGHREGPQAGCTSTVLKFLP